MSIKISALPAALDANLTGASLVPVDDALGNTCKGTLSQFGGRVGLLFSEFNVKAPAYGAVGDGATNDTTAIQAALTAAAVVGGVVYFPAGTYRVTTGLTVGSNVTVRGAGAGIATVSATIVAAAVFTATSKTNITIEELTISGSASFGVLLSSCSACTVRRCTITGMTETTHVTAYAGGVFTFLCTNVTIEGNILSGNGAIASGKLTGDIQINGSGAGVATAGIIIRGNRCASVAGQYNIIAYDLQRSQIINNICSGAKTGPGNNNGYGIAIYMTTLATSATMREVVIAGNSVSDVGGTGIYVQSSLRIVVTGNEVYNAGAVQDDGTLVVGGIGFSNCMDSTCTGNIVYNCGKSGIVVGGTPFGTVQADGRESAIEGFSITGNQLDTIAGPGIYFRGPLKRATITGNSIKSTTGAGISTALSEAACQRYTQTATGASFVGNATLAIGSPTISSPNAAFSLDDIGLPVTGTGIPANTTLTAVATDGLSATMSANSTVATTTGTIGIGGLVGLTITGNAIESPALRGIDLYDIARSVIGNNTVIRSGGNGISTVYGVGNLLANNEIWNGGTIAANTYSAIDISRCPGTEITGNVVGMAGVSAGRTVADGVTTNASTALTSATAAFTTADVGRSVTGTGIPGSTTIAAYVSATQVTLSAAATATATGVSITFGPGGYKYGISVDAASVATRVLFNRASGAVTADYNVDSTVAAGILFAGNYNSAASVLGAFPMRQQAVLQGSAASMTQLQMGDSSSVGAVGTRWSGADAYLAQNSTHTAGSDLWHQSNAGAASKLWMLRANGDAEFSSAVLASADGTNAAFWGTPKVSLMATGGVKVNGTQVVGPRATGWSAMTGTPNIATVYDTSTVTLAQLAGRVMSLQAALTTHGAIGT